MLRPAEAYLSVNWLEWTGLRSRVDQLAAVRGHLIGKGMTLPTSGRLAVLHLQTMIDHVRPCSLDGRTVTAHHEPESADPSHSGIYGYAAEDDMIADLIAEAVAEVHEAKG